MRGNVVDLAVAVIIGAAFGKIVTSLVNDVFMPPIGKLMGGVDFKDLFISLDPLKTEGLTTLAQARSSGATVIAYGAFLNTIIDFTIIAFVIFAVVRGMNKLKKTDSAAPVTTKECPECLSTIPLLAKRCPHCTASV